MGSAPIERLGREQGLQVCFWRILREWNGEADLTAEGAALGPPVEGFFVSRGFSG